MGTKRKVVIVAVIALITTMVLVGIFVFTNVQNQPATTVVQNETQETAAVAESDSATVISQGQFVDGDEIHKGSGGVQIKELNGEKVLVFSDDFKVTSGPDLFVYLSPNSAGQELGEVASLGTLKSTNGAQTYTLPENFQDYKTVVIWCRAFSVTFATAELEA